MHKETISGEQAFRAFAANGTLAIGPSSSGYTLQYSADGVNYTAWDEATAADENVVVANVPYGMYLKLSGNTADVVVIW